MAFKDIFLDDSIKIDVRNNSIFRFLKFTILFIWIGLFVFWTFRFFSYVISIATFPYDWEPTDGDHLNFARRLARGLPIYSRMHDGAVISIYNPAYHYLLAALGRQLNFATARLISICFLLACPIAVFLYFRNKWGIFLSLLCSMALLVPYKSRFIFSLTNISPNSMCGFLFLISLLLADYGIRSKESKRFVFSAVVAVLCFLSKQQGVIAGLVVLVALVFEKNKKGLVTFIFSGVLVLMTFGLLIEVKNSFLFFRTTIIDVGHIMHPSMEYAFYRFKRFCINNVGYIISLVLLGVVCIRKKNLSIWLISTILHIPFLLLILGNEGGGPDYFLSFWISVVVCIFDLLEKNQKKINIFLICLLMIATNSSFALVNNSITLERQIKPDQEMKILMESNYKKISELIDTIKPRRVLTSRSIGCLVAAGVLVENEGCTMFGYSWLVPEYFNKNNILDSVQQQKYDVIVSGQFPYPKDLQEIIDKYYVVCLRFNTNYIFGEIGEQTVWCPRKSR